MIKKIDGFSPNVISNSGQCFRMEEYDKNKYEVVAFEKVLRINELSHNEFDFDCDSKEFDDIWISYFDIERNYTDELIFIDKDDTYLKNAVKFGYGMKILRQDKFEMLISYLISQRKSIPAIKKCINAICQKAGKKIGKSKLDNSEIYSFPDAVNLNALSDYDLSGCMLGYRDKYIRANARDVAYGILDLNALDSMNSNDLVDRLMKQFGVGIKVASCIALFAYHRLNVFPIDVWIKKIIDREYNGEYPGKNSVNQENYLKYAGILNQYMFYYERLKDKK